MFLGWIQLYAFIFPRIMIGGNTALNEIRRQDTAPKEVEILCCAIMSIIEIVIAVNFLTIAYHFFYCSEWVIVVGGRVAEWVLVR